MKFFEAMSKVEKELKVEYYKDTNGKMTAVYNNETMSLDDFKELAEIDADVLALLRATMKQNKYYPKQVKSFKSLVSDLFKQKTNTPDIKVDKGKFTIYNREISGYSHEPKVDTKEIKSSGSKDLISPPWVRAKDKD